MRKNVTEGLIMIKNEFGIEHKICKIKYILYEDESFEYIFTPYYDVIDLLPSSVFQGIPGLDLSLKKEEYIRKDVIPVFISERSPGRGRENLDELLKEANMDYLNQLEWLIRTNYSYSGDPMYVVRYTGEHEQPLYWDTNKKDVSSLRYIGEFLSSIAHGQEIFLNGNQLNSGEIKNMYILLTDVLASNKKMQIRNRQLGIKKAEEEGRTRGRNKIVIDDVQYDQIIKKYQCNEITSKEAAKKLNISVATFFRRLKNKE